MGTHEGGTAEWGSCQRLWVSMDGCGQACGLYEFCTVKRYESFNCKCTLLHAQLEQTTKRTKKPLNPNLNHSIRTQLVSTACVTLSHYLSMSRRPCSAVQRPSSSLTPLPTTTMEGLPAGLDYLQYPLTEAFGMPSLARECPLFHLLAFSFLTGHTLCGPQLVSALCEVAFLSCRDVSPLQSPEVSAPCPYPSNPPVKASSQQA